jgi:redox-sensitive bicupin YhaK (pirin superfamily)
VGDGFPVRSIFTYNDIAEQMSPFLLMDYAGPKDFKPTDKKLGVGEHPHRGFETVTIVYDGQVEHRDSSGGGGQIGPGDVQWMTAARGIVHEEFHGREFAKTGGRFEMIQLWVNLPKKDKMSDPTYQGILNSEIPKVELDEHKGSIRIIAGQYQSAKGPARTFSPMDLWDLAVRAGSKVTLPSPDTHTASLFLRSGAVAIDSKSVGEAELAVFERSGESLTFQAVADSKLLFMGGAPLHEPIVGYGPFVMTTVGDIKKAFMDYESGKMGHLPE